MPLADGSTYYSVRRAGRKKEKKILSLRLTFRIFVNKLDLESQE